MPTTSVPFGFTSVTSFWNAFWLRRIGRMSFSSVRLNSATLPALRRTVTIRLKAGSVAEFNRTLEKDILPILRSQKGFQNEVTLVNPNGTEVVGISLWDNRESAEAYQRTGYTQVQN